MSWSVTLNGRAYTEVNVEGTAYADETNGLPAMFRDFAADAGFAKGAGVTSATNLTPATGTLVFATDQDASAVSVPTGALVKARSAADGGKFAIGTVTGFTGTTLTIDATIATGAAAADWVIVHAMTARFNTLFETLDANGQDIAGADSLDATAVTATTLTTTTLATTGLAAHHAGSGHAGLDLGTLTANPAALAAATETFIGTTLGGDIEIPVAGGPLIQVGGAWRRSGYGKVVTVTQNGTGGRDVAVRKANLLTYSEELDNAVWTKTRASVTPDATSGPAVGTLADKLVEDTTPSASHFVSHGVAIDVGATITGSAYFDPSGRTEVRVALNGATGTVYADIDLANGVFGTVTTTGSYTSAVATIETIGAYRRVSVTCVTASDGAVNFNIALENGLGTTEYSGDGSSGVYVWGPQVVSGSAPLDYIPVGASRDVAWAGTAPDFTGQAAAATTRFGLLVSPDGDLQASVISEV